MLLPDKCPRCGKDSIGYMMSMFNTQMICFDCIDKEKKNPKYNKAVEAERESIKNGNYNFKGIGL